MRTLAILALVAGCGGDGGITIRECGDEEPLHTGDGTYYDADGSGNCGFDPTGDLMVAAMNHDDYLGSAVCGACVAIDGPSGSVTVRIVDRCPGCPRGDIDLSREAFALIADLSAGRVPISWRYVPCAVTGPVRYREKEGSNPWWLAVQVRNHRYAVARFEAAPLGGAFVELPRTDYNYFLASDGLGDGPFSFRITDVFGHELVDEPVALGDAIEVTGAGQFPLCP